VGGDALTLRVQVSDERDAPVPQRNTFIKQRTGCIGVASLTDQVAKIRPF
jgi:hypothetical protein